MISIENEKNITNDKLEKKITNKKMKNYEIFTQENYKLPKKKTGRVKISDDNFKVLKYNEYNLITDKHNYNVSQLKKMLSYYKLKKSGNKEVLMERLYNFLKYSEPIIKIQSLMRGYITREYINLHGEGFKKKKLCVNQSDFVTLDDINDIEMEQFFSFKDEDESIYAFDICSLYNHIMKSKKDTCSNPYNRKSFPKDILQKIRKFLRYSHIMKYKVKIIIKDETAELSESKQFELRALSLFQSINELGNYSDAKWFTELSKVQIIRFIRELHDIWSYRANLNDIIKRRISPPLGNPFSNININLIQTFSLNIIKKTSLEIIEKFVKIGIDTDSKNLGAYYVLGALTLVNINAAEAMPWLYQAVVYNA